MNRVLKGKKMSTKGRLALLISALVMMVSPMALALDGVDVSVAADYYSKYVWRGQECFDGSVFQPSVGIAKGGWSFGIWGSMDLEDDNNNSSEFTEIDYTIDYSGEISGVEGLGYSVGGILYDFPNNGGDPETDSTFELYVGLCMDTLLSPSVTIYQDVKSDGTYVSLAAGHSIELDEDLALDLGASLGWGSDKYSEAYWGAYTDDAALNDLALSASLPLSFGEVSVTPTVAYVMIVDSDIEDGLDAADADSDFFFAGVSVSMEF